MSKQPTSKNTGAFHAQAWISFAIAFLTVLCAIFYLPSDPWIKAFLGLGVAFLTSSCFTLAKVVRDQVEDQEVVNRLDQARLDKALASHDPFGTAA